VTNAPALGGLLRRACLAFNSRALHADGDAGAHTAAFLSGLADDTLLAMDAAGDGVVCEYLADVYRHLSVAGDNPLRQSCDQREALLNIACHGLAHAVLRQEGAADGEEEVHALLAEQWTASLLAWSQLFPAVLDTASTPCACGALGPHAAAASWQVGG